MRKLKEEESQEVKYKGNSKLRYTPTPEKPRPRNSLKSLEKNQSMDTLQYPGKPYKPEEFDPFVQITKPEKRRIMKRRGDSKRLPKKAKLEGVQG